MAPVRLTSITCHPASNGIVDDMAREDSDKSSTCSIVRNICRITQPSPPWHCTWADIRRARETKSLALLHPLFEQGDRNESDVMPSHVILGIHDAIGSTCCRLREIVLGVMPLQICSMGSAIWISSVMKPGYPNLLLESLILE